MSGNRNTYVPTRRPGKYICVPGARNEGSDSDEDHPPCQVVYQPHPPPHGRSGVERFIVWGRVDVAGRHLRGAQPLGQPVQRCAPVVVSARKL